MSPAAPCRGIDRARVVTAPRAVLAAIVALGIAAPPLAAEARSAAAPVGLLRSTPAAPFVVAAGRALGRRAIVVEAASERDVDAAFARMVEAGVGGVLVGRSPVFTSDARSLVALAARPAIPAISDQRAFVTSGGLISYAASCAAADRQAGLYAGRNLGGARPSERPVMQPTTFDLVTNRRAAKALGRTIPRSLLLRVGEIVE